MRPSFFHHLHPPTIPALQARFRYTLGAGGLAVFYSLVLVITGAVEMFYYIPTPEEAALSVQTLTFLVPFGWLMRNMHFWAAQLLVVVSILHLIRVVCTGAYARGRRFNYLLGLILLVLCLFLDFTGYILRWDEGIYWAMVTGANLVKSIPAAGPILYSILVGGREIGLATLLRFYTWHILGLVLVSLFLGIWHLFRVRRDGGIAAPPPEMRCDPTRITRSELLRREMVTVLLAGTLLILLSILLPARLAAPIQDGISLTADARAPWFFLWVQQLLRLGNPFFWGIITPLMVLAWLALIPYVLPEARPEELGKWFPHGNRLAWVSVLMIAFVILSLTILSLLQNGGV